MADHSPSTRRTSRRSVLGALGAVPIAAVGLTAAGAAGAAPGRSRGLSEGLREYDRYIAELTAGDRFSGVVLIAHRGQPVLAKAYGMADREQSVPNTVDTRFNLASASKPFTALAIVQLAQQGKLLLHDKLGTHLDGFPAELAEQVTIHQLLTHTSGIGPEPFDPTWLSYSKAEEWEHTTNGFGRPCSSLLLARRIPTAVRG